MIISDTSIINRATNDLYNRCGIVFNFPTYTLEYEVAYLVQTINSLLLMFSSAQSI